MKFILPFFIYSDDDKKRPKKDRVPNAGWYMWAAHLENREIGEI